MSAMLPLRRRGDGHAAAVETLRRFPRRWFLVATYPARYTAVGMASTIRSARTPQYSPAGAFETRVAPVGDESGVFARFIGSAR